jgi:hypothetical protein
MAEDDLSRASRRPVRLLCVLGLGVGLVASCRSFHTEPERDDSEVAGGAPSAASGGLPDSAAGDASGGVPAAGGAGSSGAPSLSGASGGGSPSAAGAAGDASDITPAGAGGAAGAGGQPASGGASEEPGSNEPVLQPSCKLYDVVGANGAVGLATSLTYGGMGVSLFTWDRPTSTALVRWSADLTPRNWTAWVCFDLVPDVSHVAALNLSNGYEEVFAASRNGHLFMRTEFGLWGTWLPLSLPARGMTLVELAAVGGSLPRVYVMDADQVYFRSKVSEEAYSAYGPWRSLVPRPARLLAALRAPDGTHRVFTVADEGDVAVAQQVAGGEFGAWQALPSLASEVVDLVAAEPAEGPPVLHALGANGALYSLSGFDAPTWQTISVAALGAKAKALASRANGNELQLFAIDAAGATYRFDSGQWVKTI